MTDAKKWYRVTEEKARELKQTQGVEGYLGEDGWWHVELTWKQFWRDVDVTERAGRLQ